MSAGNDEPLPADLQLLLVDVVDGRRAAADPNVSAACAANPEFAALLHGALRTRDLVVEFHGAEREALRAGASPLEPFAVAAARRQLGLPPGPARAVSPGRRWRPWLWLALAAGSTIGVLWRGQPAGPRPSDHALGLPIPVHVSADGRELVWDGTCGDGEHFEVVFRDARTRQVVQPIREAKASRLPMPDLRDYPADVLVEVRLVDGGNNSLRESAPLTLPARTPR